MVDLLDRDVGRIIEHVDSSGLKRNTLVIFTSDNSGSFGNRELLPIQWAATWR